VGNISEFGNAWGQWAEILQGVSNPLSWIFCGIPDFVTKLAVDQDVFPPSTNCSADDSWHWLVRVKNGPVVDGAGMAHSVRLMLGA
jgi:hypothetical protein